MIKSGVGFTVADENVYVNADYEPIFFSFIMGIYLIHRKRQIEEPQKIYDYVWGSKGLDSRNEYFYITYIVSGDSRYNGIYAYLAILNTWGCVYMFKRNLVLSIIFGVFSIGIYLNMSRFFTMNILNLDLPYYISFARLFLILSITFAVLCFCCKRGCYKKTVTRIVIVLEVVLLILGSLVFISKKDDNYYNGFVDKKLILKNNSEFAKFYPYHTFDYKEKVEYGNPVVIRVGTTCFFDITSNSEYIKSSNGTNYYLTYFESLSPYLNLKFYMENGSLMGQMRNKPPSYYPQSVEKIKIDGYKVKIYIAENEYNVFVNGLGKSVYATLTYGDDIGVTPQSFAEEVVNQLKLVEKAIDDNIIIQ